LLFILVVLTALSCVSSSAGHFKKIGGGGLSGFHRPLALYPTLALPIYSGYGGYGGGYGSGYGGYGSGYSGYGYGGYGSSFGGYGW
ncbi:keratin-associated protein 19-2-like, partial [Penaeus monodon]